MAIYVVNSILKVIKCQYWQTDSEANLYTYLSTNVLLSYIITIRNLSLYILFGLMADVQ